MEIAIVVAMAENGVIGRDGGLPWRLSTDLKRFKADTMGKPIVMGRKTWDGIPRKPLPGRINIVVTRNRDFQAEGAEVVHSLEDAIALANAQGAAMPDADEICIVGGARIYAQALPLAGRLRVTHVLAEVDGDARFPPIDPDLWMLVHSEDFPAGEKDSHPTRHAVYEKRWQSS